MSKRIIALVLLALTVVLASCGTVNTGTEDSDTDTQGLVESSDVDVEPEETKEDVVGGTGVCKVHEISFHSFLTDFTVYVGEDAFAEWISEAEENDRSAGGSDGCLYPTANLYRFIREFDIPREKFVEILNSDFSFYYNNDFNVDVLYDGTYEDADRYYRDALKDPAESYRKLHFEQIKDLLTEECDLEKLAGYLESSGKSILAECSLAELVYFLDVSRDELEAIAAETLKFGEGVMLSHYDYDFDMIYNDREATEDLINEHSAFYVDLLFCGLEPRELPYK